MQREIGVAKMPLWVPNPLRVSPPGFAYLLQVTRTLRQGDIWSPLGWHQSHRGCFDWTFGWGFLYINSVYFSIKILKSRLPSWPLPRREMSQKACPLTQGSLGLLMRTVVQGLVNSQNPRSSPTLSTLPLLHKSNHRQFVNQ